MSRGDVGRTGCKDFFATVEARHGVRVLEPREIQPPKRGKVLAAANRAPSAGNLQAFEIVLVRDRGERRKLACAAHGKDFVATAPVVFAFCANPDWSAQRYGRRGADLHAVQGATVVVAYAQRAATALGFGSTWVGAFDEAAAAEVAGGLRPVCLLLLGYPGEVSEPTSRRALDDLVREGRRRAEVVAR